jgi:hypothetical protein
VMLWALDSPTMGTLLSYEYRPGLVEYVAPDSAHTAALAHALGLVTK